MSQFANIWSLMKRLQSTIMPNWDIWDSIVIMVILNSLHDNFEIIITSILEQRDKTINEI